MKKRLFCLCLLLSLCACNTIQGLGEDLGQAGNAISDTAQSTKKRL